LREAKTTLRPPYFRRIGIGGGRAQFLSSLVEKQGCLCGTLSLTDEERLIALIDAETDGSTWRGALEPKDVQGRQRKIEEQALFFAVKENTWPSFKLEN
jgi:hypothetical protein